MRILIDSNVIIRFWKNPDEETADILRSHETFICGIVRSELMHGARSEDDLKRISRALDEFGFIPISDEDWDLLGGMLYKLRINGVTVPFKDAVLAMLAVKNRIPLWTFDKHFLLIKEIYDDLSLFRCP